MTVADTDHFCPQRNKRDGAGWLSLTVTTWIDVTILLGVTVFAIASLAKFQILTSSRMVLSYPNPIFSFLSNRQIIAVAAIVELIVTLIAVGCHRKKPVVALSALVWLCAVLAVYRFVLTVSGYPAASCGCFGALGELLYPSNTEAKASLLAASLLYGILGSGLLGLSMLLFVGSGHRKNGEITVLSKQQI